MKVPQNPYDLFTELLSSLPPEQVNQFLQEATEVLKFHLESSQPYDSVRVETTISQGTPPLPLPEGISISIPLGTGTEAMPELTLLQRASKMNELGLISTGSAPPRGKPVEAVGDKKQAEKLHKSIEDYLKENK